MAFTEKTVLLRSFRKNYDTGLSVFFAVICIIDVFGVFPIVTLPKIIISCGTYGLLFVIIICFIQIYTAILLGKSWILACKIDPNIKDKIRYPYSALTELTFGKSVSKYVAVLLNITIFGGGIPNIIVASQNLDLFTIRLFGINVSYCWWMVIVATLLCPILWLGSPKDMKLLCSLSVFAVVLVFSFVVTCLLKLDSSDVDILQLETNTNFSNIWRNMAVAYGVLSFQFDIHPTLLMIQVDMKRKLNIDLATIYGFAVSLSMFLVTYLLASVKLGNKTSDSLVESLETSVLLHLSALLVAFQLCLSSAISNTALYQNLEDRLDIPKDFSYRRCILRSLLTLLALALAESVSKLDLVMSLIGGTLTGPLVFIFPPMIYIKLLSTKPVYNDVKLEIHHPAKVINEYDMCYSSITYESKRKSVYLKLEMMFCILVISIGIIGTVATTYVNISNTLALISFTKPCIYNITSLFQ